MDLIILTIIGTMKLLILLLLETLSFMEHVNYENTITGNFNKLFNYKKTIVNIGFNGTGPLIQFASMKRVFRYI